MKVKYYLETWLESRAYALAQRTVESYEAAIRLYLVPRLGETELTELSAISIEQMLGAICRSGKTRSALMAYTVLRTALKAAVRMHLIQDNPMSAVIRPKHTAAMRRWLTSDEVEQYIPAALRDRYRVAWLMAICCGLRRGEICGLRWADIDLDHRIMHIRNQRIGLASGRVVDTLPKSASGVRDISLPKELCQLLSAAERAPSGYVVTDQRGKPISPCRLDKLHRRMVEAAGLPPVTLHGLRHTMASHAINQGVHIRVLQSLLGHASYSTTAQIYAHVESAAAAAAIDKITGFMLHSTCRHSNS